MLTVKIVDCLEIVIRRCVQQPFCFLALQCIMALKLKEQRPHLVK